MTKNKYILMATLLIFFFSKESLAQDAINYSLGLEMVNSYTYWENGYSEEKYDNVGVGTFIIPSFKMNYGKIHFEGSVYLLSYFNFTGPNGLTITGPDNDIDAEFNSSMRRNDLNFQIGYELPYYVKIELCSKYLILDVEGDNKHKFNDQTPFSYTEQGLLFGPGIKLNYPLYAYISYLEFDMNYLSGQLNYEYDGHGSVNMPVTKNTIDTRLIDLRVAFTYQIKKNILISAGINSEYYFKNRKTIFPSINSDLWFIGLNTGISYTF